MKDILTKNPINPEEWQTIKDAYDKAEKKYENTLHTVKIAWEFVQITFDQMDVVELPSDIKSLGIKPWTDEKAIVERIQPENKNEKTKFRPNDYCRIGKYIIQWPSMVETQDAEHFKNLWMYKGPRSEAMDGKQVGIDSESYYLNRRKADKEENVLLTQIYGPIISKEELVAQNN